MQSEQSIRLDKNNTEYSYKTLEDAYRLLRADLFASNQQIASLKERVETLESA